MNKVRVINGPNLNMLGQREPDTYGTTGLDEVIDQMRTLGGELGLEIDHVQSNHEGAIIDAIQSGREHQIEFFVINPGALTHTSVGLRDAFLGIDIPFVEVHISNIFARDEFRKHSYLSDIAASTICGCGVLGYQLALRYIADRLSNS